jgi:hypothetical protein
MDPYYRHRPVANPGSPLPAPFALARTLRRNPAWRPIAQGERRTRRSWGLCPTLSDKAGIPRARTPARETALRASSSGVVATVTRPRRPPSMIRQRPVPERPSLAQLRQQSQINHRHDTGVATDSPGSTSGHYPKPASHTGASNADHNHPRNGSRSRQCRQLTLHPFRWLECQRRERAPRLSGHPKQGPPANSLKLMTLTSGRNR